MLSGRIHKTVKIIYCSVQNNGGYTRSWQLSWQRLSEHVPVAIEQILNNAIVGLQQWQSRVFYVLITEMLQARRGLDLSQLRPSSVRESVKRGLEPDTEE
jgi:hypothetical protein